ncbi:MAG: restriction endonuclease subunit S [Bacteroidales bacterium]|nr:restriction endonuclease subunit S [Bacteroidales bacterium]
MSKQKNILIPELRFPEFKDDGEWVEKQLSEVCDITNGKANAQDHIEEGQYPLFDRSEVIKASNEYIFNCEAVIIPGEGMRFIPKYYEGKFNLHQRAYALKDFACDGQFVFYSMLHRSRLLSQKAVQSTVLSLRLPILQNFPIEIPEKSKEQQKIASCLSSLDELIAAHNNKLQALKTHKKGLMQNLFPQEGEKVPKYRFPEFKEDGEWVFEPLSNVYSFLVTNSFSRAKLNYKNGYVKNIHYGDIHTKFSVQFDITKEEVPYVNPNISLEKIKNENYCKVGDIVFADASEDLDDVGKSIEIVNLNKEKLLAGLHTLLARQIEFKLSIGFGSYLFKSEIIRKQIKREAQGAKVLGISGTRLSNITIYYPTNKKEQKKIASCLSSLDEIITAQAEKTAQLQWHKKGLMQGLFPKIV